MLPLAQVSEFSPHISLGGAFFTPGHAAVILSENGPEHLRLLDESRHLAAYYVAVRGTGNGRVRPSLFDSDSATIRYDLTPDDVRHFALGLGALASALLHGGADAIYPGVHRMPRITSTEAAVALVGRHLPHGGLSPTTVHAFSTCPSGERRERCAVDSFGKFFGTENLYVNDASMLPGSPGVNPMGSIMALASRNAERFLEAAG